MKKIFITMIILAVSLFSQDIYTNSEVRYNYNNTGGAWRGIAYDIKTNKPITGILKKYYPGTGRLLFEMQYKNGKVHGLTKSYYESGALKSESYYKEGRQNGPSKLYYESGKLQAERYMKDNEYDGMHRMYSKSGVLMHETEDKDGIQVSSKLYDESGELIGESKYGIRKTSFDPFSFRSVFTNIVYYVNHIVPTRLFRHYSAIAITLSFIFFFIFVLSRTLKIKAWTTLIPSVTWAFIAFLYFDTKSVNNPVGSGLGILFIETTALPLVFLISIFCISWYIISLVKVLKNKMR